MTDGTLEKLLTVDDLMALGEDAMIEVIDGEIVEMNPVGMLHHLVAGNIYRIIDGHVVKHKLGYVFMDGLLYLLFKEGKGIKGAQVPDVSFVSHADMLTGWDIEKPFPGSPTLAVEVVSPGDDADDLLKRVRNYLKAGTSQVWVVYPQSKEVHQYLRGEESFRAYVDDATMHVESLFPDLTISLSAIFDVPMIG